MKTETQKTLMTPKKAQDIAAVNNKEDDGWTYEAIPMGNYFVVEIKDEEGILLGYF